MYPTHNLKGWGKLPPIFQLKGLKLSSVKYMNRLQNVTCLKVILIYCIRHSAVTNPYAYQYDRLLLKKDVEFHQFQ